MHGNLIVNIYVCVCVCVVCVCVVCVCVFVCDTVCVYKLEARYHVQST